MRAKEVANTLSGAVSRAKKDGLKDVSIESLEAFAVELEHIVSESPEGVVASDAALEAHKAWLSSKVISSQYSHERDLELMRATVTSGQAALKAAILINGGAAAALLAFIGGIWPSDQVAAGKLGEGLFLFTMGVLSSAFGTSFTYLSQAGFGEEFGRYSKKFGVFFRTLAIVAILASFGLFIAGALSSGAVIRQSNPALQPTALPAGAGKVPSAGFARSGGG